YSRGRSRVMSLQEIDDMLEKARRLWGPDFCDPPAEPPKVIEPPAVNVAPGPVPKTLSQRLDAAVRQREPLNIALTLAEMGFSVFPLRRGTKEGFVNKGSDHGATADPVKITAAFTGTDHNVGIWAGAEFVMIGPDFYKPG